MSVSFLGLGLLGTTSSLGPDLGQLERPSLACVGLCRVLVPILHVKLRTRDKVCLIRAAS